VGGEVLVRSSGGVAHLSLSRPEARNALTPGLIDRALAALGEVGRDAGTRVVVVSGAGGAFCAGYDVTFLGSPGTADAGIERDRVEALCSAVRALRQPTIAMVDGVATGGGCDLAVACDLRFASERARFGMPPARLGILSSREGMERLAALVGLAVAKELLFSGELLDASRALAVGLVNRLHPAEALAEETQLFAEAIAANAPLSVAATKLVLDLVAGGGSLDADAEEAIEEAQLRVWSSADASEGPKAFRERRPPRFRGR